MLLLTKNVSNEKIKENNFYMETDTYNQMKQMKFLGHMRKRRLKNVTPTWHPERKRGKETVIM